MRITKRRIELMQRALNHVTALAEERASAKWEVDNQEAREIFEAVECIEELIRRVERKSKNE